MKLGIRAESLGGSIRKAMQQAAELEVAGLQVDARGDLAPDRLSDTGRREFRNLLRGYNLQLTALNCPLRHGLDVPDNLDPRVEYIRQVMSLAYELGPALVILQPGKIPSDPTTPAALAMRQALIDLSQHGDRSGTRLALEIGLDDAETTKTFLDSFDTGSLGLNYDPANLLLNGFDPIMSIFPLISHVLHSHAHDARKASASRIAAEVPLGAGDIDWMTYLATLHTLDYPGWIVVEQESGANAASIANGVAFLRRLLP